MMPTKQHNSKALIVYNNSKRLSHCREGGLREQSSILGLAIALNKQWQTISQTGGIVAHGWTMTSI